jgi:hypothetical protein
MGEGEVSCRAEESGYRGIIVRERGGGGRAAGGGMTNDEATNDEGCGRAEGRFFRKKLMRMLGNVRISRKIIKNVRFFEREARRGREGGEMRMGFEQVRNPMALLTREVSCGGICGCVFWGSEVLKVRKVFLYLGVVRV